MEKHEQEKPKVLTVADIRKLNEGNHRCGWTIGAVTNPNPECGCMCGAVYNKDGEPILRHGGCHTGVQCKCFPPESPEPAAPSTPSEPERVSDERLKQLRNVSSYTASDAEEVRNMARELRTLRAQLADRDNHIKYAYAALGDANRSIYLFDHIRRLREELAEKDAAIEKARRDALEEAANHIEDRSSYTGYSGVGKILASWLRALAAQKKEG